MKFVLVLGVLVGVLLVQAHAAPKDDRAVGQEKHVCQFDFNCKSHHCFFPGQTPYCNFWGQCKCGGP